MPAQLLPYWQPGESVGQSASASKHRLFWEASVPPLGLATYVVGRSNDFPACPKAVLSSLELVNSIAGKHVCPQPYECTSGGSGGSTGRRGQGEGATGSELSISNRWLEVKLNGSSGLVNSVKVRGGDSNRWVPAGDGRRQWCNVVEGRMTPVVEREIALQLL